MTDSRSLWNFASSPGWTEEQLVLLKLALMKFGIGRWKKIVDAHCLPNKTVSQMYMQTQRLLGQQSLCEFMGLNVDIDRVKADNSALSDKEVFRKQGLIINNNIDYNRKKKLVVRQENEVKYGLTKEQIKQIKIPRMATTNSLKDLLNWKKYFAKHKPSLVQKLQKLDQFLEDCDLYLQAIRIKNQKPVMITLGKEEGKNGEIEYTVLKCGKEDLEEESKEEESAEEE